MSALESKGAQESWEIFGDSLLEPQGEPFSLSGKRIRHNKKAAWINSKTLRQFLRSMQEMEKGTDSQREHRNTSWVIVRYS